MYICLSQILITFHQYRFILIFIVTIVNCTKQSLRNNDLIVYQIKENSPVGQIVGQIESPGFNPPFEIHNYQNKKFSISINTGIILVAEELDREKQNLYSFVIISANGDTKSLQIKIIDVNDNAPKFDVSNIEKSIPENNPIGSKVDLTTVYDPDEGINSVQSVKITSGDSDNIFAVDYHDGSNGKFFIRLILKQTLDYESISQFNLVIQAVDGGNPPLQSTLLVKINVQNANDNVPEFDISRYITSVKENQEINKTFLRVRATDNDIGTSGELFYFIDDNSSDNQLFAVNHKSGDVFLRKSLDFEKAKSHQITVGVKDNSPPFHTSKVPVSIDVIDINDNAPEIHVIWTEFVSQINRDVEPNSIVAHVKVTDSDAISTSFDLQIINQTPFQLIKILPKMWELKTVKDLNEIKSDSIILKMKATDFPEPSLFTIKTFNITLQQSLLNNVSFQKGLYILEFDAPIFYKNHPITTLDTVKPLPLKSNISFVLLNEKRLFKVNQTTGELSSNSFIDCGTYLLNVSLYSRKAKLTLDKAQIHITIKSGRKQPLSFEKGFIKILVKIEENQCFPQISVKNRHCGIRVRYEFKSLVKPEGPFQINEHGVLCIRDNIKEDLLKTNRYLYRVDAFDENNSSAFCLVVFILRSSIITAITKDIVVTLSLNEKEHLSMPIAKVVGTFLSLPPIYYFGIIQYQIVTDEYSFETVSVDSQSGDISLKKYPNDKKPIKVSIKISVGEDVSTNFISILTIEFKRLYFIKPVYHFILNKAENAFASSNVGKVSVFEDPTRKEFVTYHLVNDQDYSKYFSVDKSTGFITHKNLNLLLEKCVSLNIYAVNNVGIKCHTQALIYIEETLHKPILEVSDLTVNIWENAKLGYDIIQIMPKYSSEKDAYRIISSADSENLEINPKSGQIVLLKQYDREVTALGKVTVEISNQIGSTTMNIYLNILDVNDNKPNCTKSSLNVFLEDNLKLGVIKCPLQCSDPDSFVNANLSYRMKTVSPTGVRNPFKMQSNTGCLVVDSTLDTWSLNPEGKFNLVITVSDNGLERNLETDIQIHIMIVDTNNHDPLLISFNEFNVAENAIYGTEIGTLLIEDQDKGLNGEIEIYIKNLIYSQCFYLDKINRNTFIIRSKNLSPMNLNLGSHTIPLVINDRGSPPKSSTTEIFIYIDGINKNAPEILSPSSNEPILYFCPLLAGSEILKIKSSDPDEGINGLVNYFLPQNDDENDYIIAVDLWSGLVTTKTSLSCSHNSRLRINVSDLGYPRKYNTLNIILKPFEKSDTKEKILNRNFTFIISDDSQPGSRLGDLNHFPEYLGSKCLFANNSSSSFDNVLHIRYDSQQIILLKNDLSVGSNLYQVIVTFHKSLATHSSMVFFIKLIFNRVTYPWPVFSESSPTIFHVRENLPSGTVIGQFSVKFVENSETRYSIQQPNSYFVINSRTGILVTFRSFDRESEIQDQFTIEIIATLANDPKRFSILPVKIFITDENDHIPKIMSPLNFDIDVPFPLPMNENLIKIVAKDEDIGQNGLLQYSIYAVNENIFSIDQSSGEIWLTSIPKKSSYKLNVTISDLGRVPNSLTVQFSIRFQTFKNKIQPKLLSQSLVMHLSLPQKKSGYVLGKIFLAQISSENLDLRYHLIAGKFSQIFSIHSVSGEIKTQKPVTVDDMGNSEIIQLSVVLQSLQDPSIFDIEKLIINIDHGNQNTPSFFRSFYKLKLPEDEAITDFMTIAAFDPDLGIYGEILYKLTGDVQDKKIFVDPLTGRLSCSPLNFMEKKVYNLEIVATDCKGEPYGLSTTAKVMIIVQNTKTHPLLFNATHFSLKVLENSPPGTTLGRINTIQPTTNTEIIYILNPGHSHIRINSTTGELSTNGPLHRQTVEFIDLTIHAFAKSSFTGNIQTASAIVDIRIIDVNDNPPIPSENPVKIIIPNTDIPQKPLAKLSATDADKTSTITYKFDLTDSITQSLEIMYNLDSITGNLFLKSSISSREKARHFLKVVVSDNGLPRKSTLVLLDISLNHDQQYLQILPEKTAFRVQENSVPGTFIGQLKLVDNCTNESVEFSLIDGVNNELVYLHESSGKIFVAGSGNIDREKVNVIILWTQAICPKENKRGYKKVIIHVDDVDDNQPIFSQKNYVAFLNEGQPPKTSVIRITVYDPDIEINSQVEYFIEFYSTPEEFFIDHNGEIKTNMPLNFHTKSVYNLVIKANSKASPLFFDECRVTVYIININDQRPKISPSIQNLQIDTKKRVGSFIVKITAKDSDGPDGICYRIRNRKLSNERLFLSVAYDSGEIFLSRKLMVSDIGKHELDIVADDGKFSSSAILFVEIIDNNNHMPVLRENTLRVVLPESLKFGSSFYYIHGLDSDQGENARVTFELLTHSSLFGLRNFDNNTASLYLIHDSEPQKSPYFVGIQLTDNCADPQKRLSSVSTIAVLSTPKSSKPPIFIKNVTDSLTLSESTIPGSRITKLICKDVDSDSLILYRINKSQSDSDFFHIDLESGDLFLTKSLNYNSRNQFYLIILCEISGAPQRMSIFNMTLNVSQQKKWYPAHQNNTISIQIKESNVVHLPALILNLKNWNQIINDYSYSLLSVSPDKPENIKNPPYFELDSLKNIWLMKGNLFQCNSWNLVIMAIERKNNQKNISFYPYQKEYIYVKLKLPTQAVNNLKTCVEVPKLTGVINENEPPSTAVLELPMWYPDIKYNLTVDDNFILFCDSLRISKCVIKTRTILDFETRDQYRLQLLVKGSIAYKKSCSHVLMVEMSVLDMDEYSPEFTQPSYSHNVEGGVPKLKQILFTVHATDRDKGRFGLVKYQIINSPSEHFGIKNESGAIFIKYPFTEENDDKLRIRRSANKEEKPKYRKKSFQLQISASSGIKTSYTYVELIMLVPGSYQPPTLFARLTELHIILLATVPVTVIVLLVVLILLVLLKKKYICIKNSSEKKESNCPSSRTDSPKTNSWNTQNSAPSSAYKKTVKGVESRRLPDIAQYPLNKHATCMSHSDTQDFNLSSEDVKQLTSSSLGTNDDQTMFSPYSEPSSKIEDCKTHFTDFNNPLLHQQGNFESGIGTSQKRCNCYDDFGIGNKRVSKIGPGHKSNGSLTSSSTYSAISNSQSSVQQKMPIILSIKNPNCNTSFVNNSVSMLRDGAINFSMSPNARPSLGIRATSRKKPYIYTANLKSNSDISEMMPLDSRDEFYRHGLSDVRNNNHLSSLPMPPNYREDEEYSDDINFTEDINCPSYQSTNYDQPPFIFSPNSMIQPPPLQISAMSSNVNDPETFTQHYSDVTEI